VKILIRKELRENLKLAVLGFVVFTVLVVWSWRDYAVMMKDVLLGLRSLEGFRLQPVHSGLILAGTGWLCVIFGAVLGWMQIFNERHRDLWAFLVHRPVSRTQIFFGKVIAGLGIYIVAAGLPLVCFVVWAGIPGHVAAPFQWAMALQIAWLFLAGIAFYFAGMLTGLRQARWYASRTFGLGLAFMILLANAVPNWRFWQILVAMLIGIAILAAAVWGGFHSDGHYKGQPALGKLGLTASITVGAGVVAFIVFALLASLFPNLLFNNDRWTMYVMTKDGTIYKEIQGGRRPPEFVDLDGKPLIDAKTGRMIELEEFIRRACNTISIQMDREKASLRRRNPPIFFSFWQATPDTIWYYWNRYGRLVGYDIATRRCIGSLGPNGFANDLSGGGDRFNAPDSRTLQTATAIYQTDVQNRATRTLFTTEKDETILGATDVFLNGNDWDHTVVATKRYIRLLTPEGKVVWKTPNEQDYPDYGRVRVSFLEKPGQCALWFAPPYGPNKKAGWKLPTHVAWIDSEQGLFKSMDLPNLNPPWNQYPLRAKVLSLLIPPALWAGVYWDDRPEPPEMPWKLVLISLAPAAVVWVPLGLWLARRHNFDVRARLGWAVFHLLCGLPGFLAFLSVQEWPVRTLCSNCEKLRSIDREKCEHCGADFAPPEKNGTEIFAPLEITRA
jgi:ABC-type transport system involved in multi-copper enzyme maturation permease subunit